MKRTMLLLMALLAFAHAALAEDFSAYAVKTNGFAVFAPNPILENGDMFFKTWSDRVGTVGDGYFWHFEWMRGGSVYRDLPYEVAVDQRWSPLEFMPVGGECYVIAQTVLQKGQNARSRLRCIAGRTRAWSKSRRFRITESAQRSRCLAMRFPSIKGKPA